MCTKSFLRLSLVIVFSISLSACQDAETEVIKNPLPEKTTQLHAISTDKALSNLDNFLMDGSTRGGDSHPKVVSVIPMRMDEVTTRVATSNANNILYVANFSENKGFAILAGDDRIQEKVIAVADKSNLTKEDVDAVASFFKNNEKYIDKVYPTTGDGIFTVKDYPDESFLNPNTFSTYDSSMSDNWVGNFSEDDGQSVTRVSRDPESGKRKSILTYCAYYARDEVHKGNGSGVGPKDSYTSSTTLSDWKDIKQTNNILSAYAHWDQKPPFNDLYPNRRRYLIFGTKRRAPAGCFPLSLAKIMTHFRQPASFSYNGYVVNWDAMNNTYSSSGQVSAAVLLRGISEWCGSMYFYAGTFTFPSKASSFLKDMGFCDVNRFNYDYDRVSSMIDNGRPVIIYAIPGIRVWSSHAWIIDGYKIKSRQKVTKQYKNGKLIDSSTTTETCRMVHCDFGWGGPCNGYYVDGVFKLNSNKNDYDYPWLGVKDTNFNHHMRIITYK